VTFVEKERVAESAFGALLRRHRLAAGLSQETLAELSRLSVNGISALERGERRSPYRDTVALLTKALNLAPAAAAELEAAAARPRQQHGRVLPQTAASDGGAEPATNLPSSRTSLVGRETEIADIVGFLPYSRLVTVTGAGGVGKTRTALAVGESLLADMKAGVWFVELAPVAQGSLVPGAIVQVLNLQESPNRPLLETLLAYLKQKSLLLILDNCEHVISEAAALADALLRGCAHLRILATSREPLRIAGEQTYRLPSLHFPTPRNIAGLSAAGATEYAALVLFVQRAHAIDRGFVLSDENAPVVADICRRLDGIPLAIELVAARVNILPVQALATKLKQRLRILTGGDRTALPRHQTMRALIDWSYDLLLPPEQRLFEKLSVFAGGCTLASAATVCADDGVDEVGVLELLSSLTDKSLVVADLDGSLPRYRLLESSRQYAWEKLTARGEQDFLAHRHALWYADFAELLRRAWDTTPDRPWISKAEEELENWRVALEWALGARGDVELGQRLAGALLPVWENCTYFQGRLWVRAALDLADESTPKSVVAQLLSAETFIDRAFGDHHSALAAAETALGAWWELGDPLEIARAQSNVARLLERLGRGAEAEPMLRNALEAVRALGNRRLEAFIIASMADHDDLAQARSSYAEALAIYTTIGAESGAALVGFNLAEAEFRAGETEPALRHAADALAIYGTLHDTYNATIVLGNMAAYFVSLARYDEAQAHANEALHLAREQQQKNFAALALQHLAAASALSSQVEAEPTLKLHSRAATILGFVDACLAALESPRGYTEQQEYDRMLTVLRDAMGTDELAKQMGMGAAMTQDQAVEYALSLNDYFGIGLGAVSSGSTDHRQDSLSRFK
jgi:predicted ATPase/transcriptional regulator with XRE-family HTH domain